MSQQLKFSFPSPSQFKHFGSIISKKEKFFLFLALLVLIGSLVAWTINYYISSTEKHPQIGGEYTEGVIGQPLYVNPIISQSNEIDATLCKLLFSSLLTYDKDGNLANDLTERFELSNDGKKYTFYLKHDIKWHDKTDLNARDVAFTIKLIQDRAFQSSLRGDWQNIGVNVVDDFTLEFTMPEPHAPFLNKLTFGVLPRHIFEEIPADKFILTEFNLKPVGSGPFVFSHFEQDDGENIISYQLLANKGYYGDNTFIEKINFNFYSDESSLIEAYNKKEINGFGLVSYDMTEEFNNKEGTTLHSMQTPRYFAVFFNKTKSVALANKDVRRALQLATNREEIIDQVFSDHATTVYSPMLTSFGAFNATQGHAQSPFDIGQAEKILDEAGWRKGDDGIRIKDEQKLEISIITTQWQDLVKTAEIIKSQWREIGVIVNISGLEVSDIQQNFIKPREYQSILFGQEYFGNDPDPFYFWHSSGKKDPGRNIAVYDNEEVDRLLDEARKSTNQEERKQKYQEFEQKIAEDAPAVFLYSPSYVYITNSKIKGVDTNAIVNPAHRFVNIQKWYIKTVRTKK